jgi:hypothetical protein
MATAEGSGTRGRKASSKKAPGKKTPAKSTVKKTPAKKTPAKKGADRQGSAPKAAARPKPAPTEVAAQAARQLLELTGRAAEGVTSLEQTDEGWTVQVEVVEVHRIPDTTDVLGLYEVRTDERGTLQGYKRLRRYARGAAGEE